MLAGISLANKCQLLFGVAVLVILGAALAVPWARTGMLVREGQFDAARQLANLWFAERVAAGTLEIPGAEEQGEDGTPLVRVVYADENGDGDRDAFVQAALAALRSGEQRVEYTGTTRTDGRAVYRYARALRDEHIRAIEEGTLPSDPPDEAGPLRAILVIDRTSPYAGGQLLRNRIYIIAAGIAAGLMAVRVFYPILTKLILEPVRRLRETTEKVQAGDLAIRSEIRTGDEFEQLSAAFNSMLERVEHGQAQLRSMNESLDLKVSELSEANIGLFESNRLKSEFLASVSHELRTPLNSIIGFAEVLDEVARADTDADPKRVRYITNILSSGRALLEMINDLLEMAKIEAGRMEVNIEPSSVSDLIEGLVAIMRPQAEPKQIAVETQVARNLPMIETDPGKLQQILYNFLSNAIKFTPTGGTVTIAADRLARQGRSPGVRLAVSDTGPGIPYDLQDAIFEKFRQADASHTREHAGTGLGLAICRELAGLLGATVSLVSEPGHGATFYVDLPLTHQPEEPRPLMA
jgi:signal transduction histidine kinase